MNPKYDIYEEIDRYLNDELSEAELVQFKEKLSSDAEFKSIVEAQQIANDLIIDQEMIKLKERMSKEMNADNTGSGPWGKIIILSAVVTSAVLLYTYTQYSSSNAEEAKEVTVSVTLQHPATVEGSEKETTNTPVVKSEDKKAASTLRTETSLAPLQSVLSEETKKEDLPVIKEVTVEPMVSTHKEEIKQAATAAEQLAKINCETVHITADVRVDYGFDNDGEATIIIDQSSVKGGSAPYSFAIDKAAFDNDTRFSGVQDGVYHVRIKDRNNCVSQVKKEVVVKTPVKEIDEAFAPAHGERWKFPVKANADATLTIFNKSGVTVYSTAISAGHPNEWDGRTNAGVELESGNYYFAIQYSARDVVKGHISIVK